MDSWTLRSQSIVASWCSRLYHCRILVRSGSNAINRESKDSSVTIPFEQTFRNLEENRPTSGAVLEGFNFCGCGWPQHMLVPRGSAAGFKCQLFVMISDYQNDRVSRYIYRTLSKLLNSCQPLATLSSSRGISSHLQSRGHSTLYYHNVLAIHRVNSTYLLLV